MNDKPTGENVEVPAEEPQESWWDLIKVFVYSCLFYIFLRFLVFDPFVIPSESMLPNLVIGDYIIVSKSSYGYSRHSVPFIIPDGPEGRIMASDVERGDVAVFRLPRDNKTDYIKRILGVPGDRMQVRNSVLYINGQEVVRERVEDFILRETANTTCSRYPEYRVQLEDGATACKYPQYRETLPNGKSYLTLDLRTNSPADNTDVFTVPEGYYFAMGDNRDNSMDSRWPSSVGVGFVPAENFVGRANLVLYSTEGSFVWYKPWTFFGNFRGSRFFNSLRPETADE